MIYSFPGDLNNLDEYIAYHKALETTNAGVGGGASGKSKAELLAYIDSVNALGEKLAGWVDILHLKDKEVAFGSNDGHITEVGSGNLDFASIIKTAEATGVKHLCVEQDTWPLGFDSIDCVKKSYDYLAKLLGL